MCIWDCEYLEICVLKLPVTKHMQHIPDTMAGTWYFCIDFLNQLSRRLYNMKDMVVFIWLPALGIFFKPVYCSLHAYGCFRGASELPESGDTH